MQGDKMVKTKLYNDHKKLIYSMAWKFSKSTGIPVDELVSEFNLYFCYSFDNYDPEKHAKFSSFFCGNCKRQVCSLLKDMKRNKRQNEVLVDVIPETLSHNPEDSIILYDNFINTKNPVVESIVSIVGTYSLPKKGFKKWLRGILHEFGHQSKEISETFRTLQSLYDPK